MSKRAWAFVLGSMALVGVIAVGCQFEPGKRVTWNSVIDTQFPIAAGEDRRIGYWNFNDPFELNPGAVALKLNYRAGQAIAPTSPTGLTWHFRVYDSSFKTMKFSYDLDTVGKMKQSGCCNYKLSYKGSDASFPGWNVDAGDNLVWSVSPTGGTLPSGIALGINYAYTPR